MTRDKQGRFKAADPDIKALDKASKALMGSSSPKMLRANLEFLWDAFVGHPSKSVRERFGEDEHGGS